MGDDIEARVRRLEDLLEIQQLFVDYGRHLDAHDFDAYAALFAETGEVLLGPLGRAKGRDEIKALMQRVMGAMASSNYHLVTNPTITLDGDRAHSTVMWSVVDAGQEGAPGAHDAGAPRRRPRTRGRHAGSSSSARATSTCRSGSRPAGRGDHRTRGGTQWEDATTGTRIGARPSTT